MDVILSPTDAVVLFACTKEISKMFDINQEVLKTSRRTGILYGFPVFPHYKVGDIRVLYKVSEVTEWFNDHAIKVCKGESLGGGEAA